MKTQICLMLLMLGAASSVLKASDTDQKLKEAKQLVERISEAQPPRENGSGRTPEQAIKEYKESGREPGIRLEIHPVPPPSL